MEENHGKRIAGKLLEILKKFRTAMLVTHASHGALRARPMALVKVDGDTGDVWFMTSIDSGKSR